MKYELTKHTIEFEGKKLYRIRALETTRYARKDQLGGYIESKRNLSQRGNCWVGGKAIVKDNARVYEDALVTTNAKVFEDAHVGDEAFVGGKAKVFGHAFIDERAQILDNSEIYGNAYIHGYATIEGNAKAFGHADISGTSWVQHSSRVYGNAIISGVTLRQSARIHGNAEIMGRFEIDNCDIDFRLTPIYPLRIESNKMAKDFSRMMKHFVRKWYEDKNEWPV